MPNSTAYRESRSSMHGKGIGSLVVTVLLCLPSLIGGTVLLVNLLLHRHIEEWEQTSSALVALGAFIGRPLVGLAAIVGGIAAFRRSVSVEVKFALISVVGLATIATLCLWLRFGT